MEHPVTEIFKALGGSTAIARGISAPVQTVNAWAKKKVPTIPPWRRADVLRFASENGKLADLSPDCLAYLQSTERMARAA